jgi:hypothetical protein
MGNEERLKARLDDLLGQSSGLTDPQWDHVHPSTAELHARFDRDRATAAGWLASANALAEAILPNPLSPHRRFIAATIGNGPHGEFREQVRKAAAILAAIMTDVDHGLFKSIANEATAGAFDDLLDHAAQFLKDVRIDVAGVIAGVAFEDTMRRARAANNIEPPDISIEDLISAFAKTGYLSGIEAKRARAAAGLRTSATHARWDEFTKSDVESCIHFTRQFIEKTLSP